MSDTELKKEAEATQEPSAKKRGRPKKAKDEKTPVKRRRKKDWVSLIELIDKEAIVDYDMTSDLSETEAIQHKKFGIGIIIKVLDETKIEVVFESNNKVLVQNWN